MRFWFPGFMHGRWETPRPAGDLCSAAPEPYFANGGERTHAGHGSSARKTSEGARAHGGAAMTTRKPFVPNAQLLSSPTQDLYFSPGL